MSDEHKMPDPSDKSYEDTYPKSNPIVLASFMILMIGVAVFVTILINLTNWNASAEIRPSINDTSIQAEETLPEMVSTQVKETTPKTEVAHVEETTPEAEIAQLEETAPADRAEETEHKSETDVKSPQYVFPADINLVSKEQLMEIDGVGEVTAERIINYRTAVGKICNMEMLLEINGIGEKTLAKLKEYLYVSSADYSAPTTAAPAMPSTTTVSSSSPTSSATTTAKTVKTYIITTMPNDVVQMSRVNINTANADELAKCLLLDEDTAQKIVELRNNIQYFSNALELLYIDGFTESMLLERMPYIALED